MKIILASGSPRRRELLTQIGVNFTIEVSEAEEIQEAAKPESVCLTNAKNKADAVMTKQTEACLVIGADTIVVLQDEILGKPQNAAEAKAMLQRLAGQRHRVLTGVVVLRRDAAGAASKQHFVEETAVFVSPMTEDEIASYVAQGESLDKAGAYGIQGRFARYIERIEGDYYNVMGLPIGRLYREVLRNEQEKCLGELR